MSVRQGAGDGEGIAFGGNDGATLEHAAQTFDVRGGPIGEVAQGPFADLAILTVALSQQDRRRPTSDLPTCSMYMTGDQRRTPSGCSLFIEITWLRL